MDKPSLAKPNSTHGSPADLVVVGEFAIYTLPTRPPLPVCIFFEH